MEITGLIPAGGLAERLGKLPCSKEILPYVDDSGRITVISANLIRYYRLAGIRNTCFIVRKEKKDIQAYFGNGSAHGVNITFLPMKVPYGTPFTLNDAYPLVRNKIVALGFPDILFQPENAFGMLKDRFLKSADTVILGVVPCKNSISSDMIEFNPDKTISDIIIKQNRPDLKYGWFIAMWKPAFTDYMKRFLKQLLKQQPEGKIRSDDGKLREPYVGDVIRHAMTDGLKTGYLLFETGFFADAGTPEGLKNLLRFGSCVEK